MNEINRAKLKIAVTQSTPFVMESSGKYSGFEIELWEAIAKEIGKSFEYEKHNFQELIPLVAGKKVDMAFAAITINEKREEIVDFSYPTFNSGLRILLSKNRAKVNVVSTLKTFFRQGYKQLIKPFVVLLIIIFIFGNILWFAERNAGVFEPTYFNGVFQSIWLSLSAILGSPATIMVYGVHSWLGRIVIQLERLTSLAVLGLLIGEITAFITTRKIRLNIESPKDLKEKTVVTVEGTTSIDALKSFGANVVTVIKIDQAYEKLKSDEVDAVVFDAPVLVYYALNDGNKWAETVGELFDEQDYGFVLQERSTLREEINRAILTIKENGYYDVLYKKWFGETK
ncbi:MAG: transporter substrate-binding domain-containing protein [Patescibacteria group bacterium]|mgnify:CR=1 FL=1